MWLNYRKTARNLLILFYQLPIRRKRIIKRYLRNHEEPKLHIGCGKNPLKGWLNTGISPRECRAGVYLDAGKPFSFPDASFNYVYSEHLIEHLTYRQALNMLEESYRVLKPGGVMRVATPDLRFLIGLYQDPAKPIHQRYIDYSAKRGGILPSPVYIINHFHTAWGHKIIYDKETLSALLEKAGFKNLRLCEVGHSNHIALNGIEGHTKTLPAEYNLLETMVFEAEK